MGLSMSSCDITMGYLIASTVLPAFSSLLSVIRLSLRWRRGQLGWDDAWALLAMVSVLYMATGALLHCEETSPTIPDGQIHIRVIGHYMSIVGFTCTLWAVRMSILASVLRIVPLMMTCRKWAKAIGVIFALFWLSLVAQKVIICETETAWKHETAVQCPLNRANALYELFVDCIADLILTIIPLRIIWRLRAILRPHRNFLTLIFSSTFLITATCIIYEVFVYRSLQEWTYVMMPITASTTLTVCQLGILVTWIVRLCGGLRKSKDSVNSLTVIDMVFAKTSVLPDVEAVHHVHLSAVPEESILETLDPAIARVESSQQPHSTTDVPDAS